jgi:hypothetical protein
MTMLLDSGICRLHLLAMIPCVFKMEQIGGNKGHDHMAFRDFKNKTSCYRRDRSSYWRTNGTLNPRISSWHWLFYQILTENRIPMIQELRIISLLKIPSYAVDTDSYTSPSNRPIHKQAALNPMS